MDIFVKLLLLREQVADEKGLDFKNCGRECCVSLIDTANIVDKMYHINQTLPVNFYGTAQGFVNITNVDWLIAQCIKNSK